MRDVPNQQHEGSGEALGVSFYWLATPLKAYAPSNRFDPDRGDFVEYPERFILYDVKLTIKLGNKERQFNYQKLGWIFAPSVVEGKAVE